MPVTQHPGNDYYVNIVTHTIQQQSNPILGHAMLAAGYLGPYDWSNAQAAVAGAKIGASGAIPGTNAIGTVQGAASGVASNLAGLSAIGDFFNRLTQGNTWLRVGEVVAGLLILYIGLNAVMKGTPVETATHSATRTAKRTAEVIGAVPK